MGLWKAQCLNQILAGIRAIQEQEQAEEQVPRPIHHRTSVRREHGLAHQHLFEDYLADEPRWGPTVFRQQFRMRQELFLHIVHTMEARDEYFQQPQDAANRIGLSPLTNCRVALRQLAYSTTTDMFDEYLHVGDTTGQECLIKFCEGMIDAFNASYLRKPNVEDCQFLMRIHDRVHDFPGMLWSINCMHWEWKNCLAAWRGQFTCGYKGTHRTMILEAIVDHRLWIWHAYFGVTGSNNDINVLNTLSFFTEQCNGNGPVIQFTANGRQHHMRYYLANGIYPRWSVFLTAQRMRREPFLHSGKSLHGRTWSEDSVCFKHVGQ
ncbi:uncharacterized protein LOC125206785 [Salvia hispanica]|uniref:uncharacterized protein LOC125206785 n=1 Tax=Salvia hispanica TaxID=49212 RepID=UPI0020090148|nr:uncharacterized protein LOC125206785 [Salvia hispanica]